MGEGCTAGGRILVVAFAGDRAIRASRHLPEVLAGEWRPLIELLGGNQSGSVRPSKFANTKVVAIRWHDPAVTVPENDVPVRPAPSSGIRPLFDLIARHESGGNYNARFGKAISQNPMFTG